MARWTDFEEQAPELAAAVRERFTTHKHHTLATLRRDGAPRISGSEVVLDDGELWIGSMWQARKAQDLQRDPRFALHSSTADETLAEGDARISGRAVEVTDPAEIARVYEGITIPEGPMHLFRIEVDELVLTRVKDDELVVDWWRAGQGAQQVKRR
jgi:hypothetical protein